MASPGGFNGHAKRSDLDVSDAVVLRIGVTLSAALVSLGRILLGNHLFGAVPDYTHFQPGDPGLRSVMGIVQGAVNFHRRA